MTTSSNEQPELSGQHQSCTIEELPPEDAVGPSTSQPEAAQAGTSAAADQAADEIPPEQAEGGPAVSTSDAEQLQQLLADCDRLKQEGNAAYARGEYEEALQLYWQVCCLCDMLLLHVCSQYVRYCPYTLSLQDRECIHRPPSSCCVAVSCSVLQTLHTDPLSMHPCICLPQVLETPAPLSNQHMQHVVNTPCAALFPALACMHAGDRPSP